MSHQKAQYMLLGSFLLLIVVFVISVATGYISLSPIQLGRTLIGQGTPQENLILYEFRLPRILITILAGAGLAVSGAILQTITKNPLSEPGILGINAGAGLMVIFYVMFFTAETTIYLYTLPLFAFIGGVFTVGILFFVAFQKDKGLDPTKLILMGVGMTAAINGTIYLLTNRLEPEQYDFFANWIAGRIWGDDWVFVLALLPWILILLPIVFAHANTLNLLQLHENIPAGLGVNIQRNRFIFIFVAVALASASVSVTGAIAFIGLMAPHITRAIVGPRHQGLLPISAILGATLLLAADTIGRVIFDPTGIPAGIVVTMIGAPYFMYLMIKSRSSSV